ncbi:MAG: YciI family protein [Hyphomicrobiaceae bacterium]|nr:YciI family protein [Hyphomicrobiaceae bacterium]
MHYMMLLAEPADDFAKRHDPAHADQYWGAWMEFIGAMNASGIVVSGNGLQAPHTATSIRVTDGKRVVADGPFIDTKEQLGGYFIIDVADLDTALAWAARAPCATTGAVEIRPVLPPMSGGQR